MTIHSHAPGTMARTLLPNVGILPSNRPPVNGITLSPGVYLGDEPGLHSMQFLALSITSNPVLGLPFRLLEARESGPRHSQNATNWFTLAKAFHSWPPGGSPSKPGLGGLCIGPVPLLHPGGRMHVGVVVAHRHVALAHAAAHVDVHFSAQGHSSTLGNPGLCLALSNFGVALLLI